MDGFPDHTASLGDYPLMFDAISRRQLLNALPTVFAAANVVKASTAAQPNFCIFSKHLQWIKDYATLGVTAAELGFDGVDLAVREGGHVLPERVADDLPKAHAAIKKAGLAVPMITTNITDARHPATRNILKTASALGIRFYRRPGEEWGNSSNPLQRIAELQPKLRELVEINKEYGVFAGIHNHSGFSLGATPWEVFEMVKQFDARWIGSNFDIGHATVEGGLGGWRSGFKLLASNSRLKMVSVKDIYWERRPNGGWALRYCPLGDGMVDLKTFTKYLKEIQFSGPISLHFEYPLAGNSPEEQQKQLLSDMKRDLATLRAAWASAA